MAKKNLDKVFSDALRQHQTPAPAGAWERLERGLEGKKKQGKKRRIWLWLLLLSTGASGLSYGTWQYRQPSNLTKVETSYIPLTNQELVIQEATVPIGDSPIKPNTLQQGKNNQTSNQQKQKNTKQAQIPQKTIDTQPQKILYKQITPVINAPKRIAVPPMVIDRISIPPMAVKPPKKKYNIRVEITIPYRGKESKATSEPQKKKVNWQKVMKHIIDD